MATRRVRFTLPVLNKRQEDNGCWLSSPYHLALIDWVDMIYLHTNITCWTRTIENNYLNILCAVNAGSRLLSTNTQINLCYLCESASNLSEEVFLLTIQLKLEVTLQGLSRSAIYEIAFGSVSGRVAQLHKAAIDITKQSCLQQ